METQKIKIELELTPEMAFFLSLYLDITAAKNTDIHEIITKIGIDYIQDISTLIKIQILKNSDNLKLMKFLLALKNGESPESLFEKLQN